jgi:type IV fimbrial biogenesis protein FimT
MNVLPTRTTASSRSSDQAGFSLVELMIVIAVVAIMAGIAAPSFQDMLASQRLSAATSALNESLWLARSEAIKRNTAVSFEFDDIADGWSVSTAVGALEILVQEPISGVSSAGETFQFNAYGRLDPSTTIDLEIEATGTSIQHCLSINGMGRLSVEKQACP